MMVTRPFDATVATVDDGSTDSKLNVPDEGDDGAVSVNGVSPKVFEGMVKVPRVGASLSTTSAAVVVDATCKSVATCDAVILAVPAFRMVTIPVEVTVAIVASSTE